MAFESLTDKLQNVFKNLKSKGRLTEDGGGEIFICELKVGGLIVVLRRLRCSFFLNYIVH